MPKPPKHNLVGNQYHYLTVMRMAQTKKSIRGEWRAICRCRCGKSDLDVAIRGLLNGRTTSCGCSKERYEKMRGENSVLFKGCGDISGKYWGNINTRANRRNYEINISIEEGWKLYLKQERKCALSGIPIGFANANKKSSETTASLDRKDSTKGYVINNIQWVHKKINIMKNIYSQEEFINLCKQVGENN